MAKLAHHFRIQGGNRQHCQIFVLVSAFVNSPSDLRQPVEWLLTNGMPAIILVELFIRGMCYYN